MAILVISVNTQCCRCEEKINKILACLRGKYCIEKIEHEENCEKVIVRGSFCAEKLRKNIWRKAGCKIITDIIIVEVWPPIVKPTTVNIDVTVAATAAATAAASAAATAAANAAVEEKLKTECKLVPFPYPVPYPVPCQQSQPSWGGGCPLQCNCCPKPPTTPTTTCKGSRDSCHGGCCKPPPPPPPPCTCGSCSGHGDSCAHGGGRPIINCPTSPWRPQPPFCQPPWGGCKVSYGPEESACAVM